MNLDDYWKKLRDGWGWLAGQFSPVTGQSSVKAVVSRFNPYVNIIYIALGVIFLTNVFRWKPRKIKIGR